jgi:outer membrane protein assembly factor BamB
MNSKYNCKKSFTVIILLLLIFAFTFQPNTSAKFDISNIDGVAVDLFDTDEDFTLENCTYDSDSDSIILNFEPLNITYNHKQKPDNLVAYSIWDTLITPGEGDFLQLLSKFINPNLIPGDEFETYSGIKYKNDGKVEVTESVWWRYLNYTSYPMNLFRFTIDEDIEMIDKFWVGWQSGNYNDNDNVQTITMYVWSYGDLIPRWNYIHSIIYDENITYPRGFIGDELDSDKYINEEGGIDILIVGTPTNGTGNIHNSKLRSDYVEVKLGIEEGYKSNGFVYSDSIVPQSGKFKGWESVFWDSSESSGNSYIKIQVLDEDNKIIDELDGNKEGFSSSPVDLSILGIDYSELKLKAKLHSDNPQYTPRLHSWGVLWRTIDGFYDNFTYTYRVGDSTGVGIQDSQVKLSKFYSEWSSFGKNAANTRSYIGPDPDKAKDNKTYWTTEIDRNYGGWFRSPVMNDGIVYIASDNKRITAFNLAADSTNGIQNSIDVSDNKYLVESSLAVAENEIGEKMVFFATSELDNTSNKIYALNALDLFDEKWSRPSDPISSICFSSAPTIANGKIFVTSWSGRFADSPQLYYMYSWLDTLLNNALGLNNNLYGYYLNGDSAWSDKSSIKLPAGSFSSPAVDDGIIFVGCENSQGPSLLAFDESSGNLLWNASVGMIGRSSPVVAEGEDGKIVIVLSRHQSILSYNGEDKVYALRAKTGEVLWNRTIGNESTFLRSTLLKGLDFKHTIATSEPASTPAVSGNKVFIMASNGTLLALNVKTGEKIWSFDVKQGLGGILSSFYASSPAVVGNTVYIGSQDGHIYAINANNGELRIDYPIKFAGIRFSLLLYFYSSPIVTDGLVLASPTELLPIGSGNIGHLICLGDYQVNNIGEIYSTPIHVQSGKWWNKFNANYNTTKESNITFRILDGDGNTLISGLNGSNNDISDSKIFNTGIIQLCAELETEKDTPVLENWKVTFSSETNPPIFRGSTFTPDPSGWINSNKPICKIEVYDNFPGLDVSSAKYRLIYKNNEKSKWYNAECTGVNGTKSNQTVTADVTKIEPENDLKRIEISIRDLSNNREIFTLGEDFKLDKKAPTSYIESTILSQYNEPFRITANASDSGGNQSGVKTISLYYRLEGEENWTQYGSSESPYEWVFDIEISSLFEICTIATDRAGNSEEFPEEVEYFFVYDKIIPSRPNIEELYQFASIPEFSIEFLDDFRLKDVEYRLSFRGEWIRLNSEDINSPTYTGEWTLEQADWDYMENDKIYHIYFRVTDVAGNQYQTSTDQDALAFTKDTIPPGAKIDLDLSDLEGGGWKDEYIITAYIPYDEDIDYVTLEYRYSPDNDKWSNWEKYGETLNRSVYEWKFTAEEGSGYYEFKVKLWDYAGNYVESLPGKVSITLLQTNQIILMIVMFIVLLIFTRIFTTRMLRKRD